MELMIEDLMQELVKNGGSDLHIASGQPLRTFQRQAAADA